MLKATMKKRLAATLTMLAVLATGAAANADQASLSTSIKLAQAGKKNSSYNVVRLVNRNQPRNLTAWKVRMWLEANNGKDTAALETIEMIARKLPGDSASARTQMRSIDMADFMGQIMGFLSVKNEGLSGVTEYTQKQVEHQMTSDQLAAFRKGHSRVATRFVNTSNRINDIVNRNLAQQQQSRDTKLAELAQERQSVFAEFDKLELLRANDRDRMSNERNVNASTRSRARGGAGYAYNHLGASQFAISRTRGGNNRIVRVDGSLPNVVRRTGVVRVNGHSHLGQGGSYHNSSTGLNDNHYQDANQREKNYDRYLKDRNRKLHRQMNRIEKDEAKWADMEMTGETSSTRKAAKKLKSLSTFVDLPTTNSI